MLHRCPLVCSGSCTSHIHNVGLELGGKSPFIVFEDSDMDQAVEWVMFGCFWTNGQICSATSRLLVISNEITTIAYWRYSDSQQH